jgi:hypothetical protein
MLLALGYVHARIREAKNARLAKDPPCTEKLEKMGGVAGTKKHKHRHRGVLILVPKLPSPLNFHFCFANSNAPLWLHPKAVSPSIEQINIRIFNHTSRTWLLDTDELSSFSYARTSVAPRYADIYDGLHLIWSSACCTPA